MDPPNAIRTARVPRHLAGSARLRRGLEHWLQACDLAAHGLPTDAVLLVRHLRTGWGTVLHPDRSQRYAPLRALMAGAHRAATADASADVVWFANEAELLACLARDALAQCLGQRWWWRSLQIDLPARHATQPALTRWLQSPRSVPGALQWLGAATAQAWLHSLEASAQVALLQALAQVYCLAPQTRGWVMEGRLASPITSPGQALAGAPPPHRSDRRPERAALQQRPTGGAGVETRLQQLCAALARDATAAQSPARLARLATARCEANAAPGRAPRPAPGPPVLRPATADATVPGRLEPPMPSHPGRDLMAVPQSAMYAADEPPPATAAVSPTPSRRTPWSPAPAWVAPVPVLAAAHGAAAPAPASQPWTEQPAHAPLQRHLCTRDGGLLFLLNAALRLQFYGDFSQPRQAGLECPPWRLLLLAGRAWCRPGFRSDPLYAWLHWRAAGARQAVPYALWQVLHAHLVLALAGGEPARWALKQMLGLAATVRDAGERLDVHFSLGALPLAVRLAGLDRDPGWIPAAGCDVRFHFD